MAGSTPTKAKNRATLSQLEEDLATQLRGAGITFQREYLFHPSRRFRFDFAIPEYKIAVECEGGLYGRPVICHNCGVMVMIRMKNGKLTPVRMSGRHNRSEGYKDDLVKYNDASLMGWRLFRFDRDSIRTGIALATIQKAIEGSPLWQLSEK